LCAIPSTSHTINKVIFTALYTINHSTQFLEHKRTTNPHRSEPQRIGAEASLRPASRHTYKRHVSEAIAYSLLLGFTLKAFLMTTITNNRSIIKW